MFVFARVCLSNIESIRKRFKTYVSETQPIIDVFKQQGKCWHVIADRPVDVIRAEVSALIKKDTGMKPTKMGQVMKAVHAASDGAHALEGKAKEAVARVAHDVEELPRGVKLGLAVAFLSVLAFAAHRSLA